MVKQHYKTPVELLPSLQSVLRLETFNKRCKSSNNNNNNLDLEVDFVVDSLISDSDKKLTNEHKNGMISKYICDNAECTIVLNGDEDNVLGHSNTKLLNKCGRSVDTCDILTNKDCNDVNSTCTNNIQNCYNIDEQSYTYNGTSKYEIKIENYTDTADLSLDGNYDICI